jgi:uncharacterized protein YndB with AHSA1/START domain
VGAATMTSEVSSDREIVVERVFQAPRELVWLAWTDAKHLDKWWGPNGFRNQTHSMNFSVGGVWRYTMHGPDGKDWPNWIRYDEIAKPDRIAYSHGGEGDEPHFHGVVTFSDLGKKRTKVVMRLIFPSAAAVAEVKKFGAVEGGQQTLARLAGFLPHLEDGAAEKFMVLTRLFDAPPKLVFEAWTKPEMLARWWGPKGFKTSAQIDFRPGGAYRMIMVAPDGNEYPFHGKYTEIVPNERIVFDAFIETANNLEVQTIVTFTEENGKTLLTVLQTIPTPRAEGQLEGWNDQLEKLAAMLRAS